VRHTKQTLRLAASQENTSFCAAIRTTRAIADRNSEKKLQCSVVRRNTVEVRLSFFATLPADLGLRDSELKLDLAGPRKRSRLVFSVGGVVSDGHMK
jgi:hypothetical protein